MVCETIHYCIYSIVCHSRNVYFMCIGLCCVSKSINTNPAVASECFHMSQPSRFGFGCQHNLILPGYPLSPTLHYSLCSTPHLSFLSCRPLPLSRTPGTFSPVFIRLLAEKSFRERVTSLWANEMRKEGGEQGCHHLQTENITGKPELRGIVHLQLLVPIDFHSMKSMGTSNWR